MINTERKTLKILSFLLCIVMLMSLFACSKNDEPDIDDGEDNDDDIKLETVIGGVDNSILENYIYLPQHIDMPVIPYPVLGATAREDQLFYWYMDKIPQLVVVELTVDGNVVQRLNISLPDGIRQVASLKITDRNEIEIINVVYDDNNGFKVNYGMFNMQGENIFTSDLSQIISNNSTRFHIENAITTDDGNIAILTRENIRNLELYLLNNNGTLLGQLQTGFNPEIVRLKDDRVVVLSDDGISSSLREIDFKTGEWGETLPFVAANVNRLFPTVDPQPFDMIIDDGNYLIGYTLETGIQTPLLNMIEAGIVSLTYHHVGFFSDGHFFTLTTDLLPGGSFDDWRTELSVFARFPRGEVHEQQTILTLGGIWISDEIRREIVRFNRENQDYQIQLIDYSTDGDLEAAILRLQVEMITGRGPDIIYNNLNSDLVFHDGIRIPQIDVDFMVDLNTLIDEDPEIIRAEFFPNFMNALISQDGTLPFIATSFTIDTMIATNETAPQLMPLTFETLLNRLSEADEPHLVSSWMLRDTFLLNSLHYSGDAFVDHKNNQANLDSDAFIQLLEIAAGLPDEPIYDGDTMTMATEVRRLHNGEQLLYQYNFSDPMSFQYLTGMLGDDVVVIGMPTPTGGRHILKPSPGVGINITSSHQDAAWRFVRRLLLPDAFLQVGFPLRIDKFEARIAECMTPVLWEETNPEWNAVEGEEMPIQIGMGDLDVFYMYAMTESEAARVREIIRSADMSVHFDETISMIVMEDTLAFFNGIRTAEETARIIQNRVQTYLNERG